MAAEKKVEVDVVANDRSDAGLASFERKMKRTSQNAKKNGEDTGANFGKGIVSAVEAFSPKLATQLSGALSSASSAAAPALAAGLAAAAPFAAAAISGAIIGGAGAGGVVGGLIVASRDVRVQAAANDLGSRIEARLDRAGASFVQPAINGLGRIEQAVDSIDLEGIFRNAERYVAPLADGIASGIERLGDGIESLIERAGPSVDAIAAGIDNIGAAIGDGLEHMAANGDEAADALDQLFRIIAYSVRVTFDAVNGLTEMYGILDKLGLVTSPFLEWALSIGEPTKDLAKSADQATVGMDGLGESIRHASDATVDYDAAVKAADDATRKLTEGQQSLYDSATNVGKAMADARDAIKDNGKTLDAHTEKGRANREALSNLATALRKQYDETVAVNGEGPRTQRIAAQSRQAFINMAVSMGQSASAARHLADQILGIPVAKKSRIEVAADQAEAAVRDLKEKLAGIRDRTVYVNVAFNEGRLINVERRLARAGGDGAAGTSFAFAAADGGSYRTGGPQPISVSSTIENRLYLDSRPLRDYVDSTVAGTARRDSFRMKVGRR